MKALITGASSGIGFEMAKILSKKGFDLILVSKDKDRLQKTKELLGGNIKIIAVDLANETKVKELYILCKKEDIDVLINNAGFGDCGDFCETDLSKEIDMINLNIKALHILTKMFLKDMKKKNSGYILNVASSAAFMPGPLMATYYASKAYVFRLTVSIFEELRRSKSKVSISCLCPGPVATNFSKVANVKFKLKEMDSSLVASYAIEGLFDNQLIIVPGSKMKIARFFTKILPDTFVARFVYKIQRSKIYKK